MPGINSDYGDLHHLRKYKFLERAENSFLKIFLFFMYKRVLNTDILLIKGYPKLKEEKWA